MTLHIRPPGPLALWSYLHHRSYRLDRILRRQRDNANETTFGFEVQVDMMKLLHHLLIRRMIWEPSLEDDTERAIFVRYRF